MRNLIITAINLRESGSQESVDPVTWVLLSKKRAGKGVLGSWGGGTQLLSCNDLIRTLSQVRKSCYFGILSILISVREASPQLSTCSKTFLE